MIFPGHPESMKGVTQQCSTPQLGTGGFAATCVRSEARQVSHAAAQGGMGEVNALCLCPLDLPNIFFSILELISVGSPFPGVICSASGRCSSLPTRFWEPPVQERPKVVYKLSTLGLD